MSLEALKNSTIQLLLFIDRTFSQVLHDQVIQKMNNITRFQSDHVSRDKRKLRTPLESPGPDKLKLIQRTSAHLNRRSHADEIHDVDLMQKSLTEMEASGDSNHKSNKSSIMNSQNHSILEEQKDLNN